MDGEPQKKPITLALQGGGAHGAFTWGVLDRLLEDPRIEIEGISGTSAGAMNAAVLADGFNKGGRAGARKVLEEFWRAISRYGSFSPYHSRPYNPLGADWSPLALWFDLLAQMVSPYQLNPLNLNPLREVLENTIDFERLSSSHAIKLYISATNVRTNHLRIFRNQDLCPEVLLASACLPTMHHAVEVHGEHYWDGGFMGNPVLEPLVRRCRSSDILIVQINPTYREEIPQFAHEIADRLNEITFNSSLMREIGGIAAITRMIERGIIQDPRYEKAYFHLIAADEALEGLGVRSKLDTSWPFLTQLKDKGRRKAETWLEQNFEHVGLRSTLNFASWKPIEYEEDAGTCPT